jgi:hypothetical protein
VADDAFLMIPGFARSLFGGLAKGDLFYSQLEQAAARSQKRIYPDDWVFEVERPRADELMLRTSECGVIKYYRAQGAMELAPYCNFFDITYSRHLDLGIFATETIGLGHRACTMHFRPGKPSVVTLPLMGVMPRTEAPPP